MIIAIDFDGTIVENSFPYIGKLKQDCVEIIQRWKSQGHTIIIWTCRTDQNDLNSMIQFLISNKIPFDYINENSDEIDFNPSPKIYYDLLIDDRNFGCNSEINWKKIDKQFKELYENKRKFIKTFLKFK